MKTSDFVMCVIGAMNGKVTGRTLLQKTCYFVSVQLEHEIDLDFRAHYYGPYSPTIDNALARMTDLGFVEQRTKGFGAADSAGFEIKRNDYEFTEEGEEIFELLRKQKGLEYTRIREAVKNIKDAGDPGYFELSIAAKAYFIIHSQGGALTKGAIRSEARELGWEVESHSLDRAVNFLEKLNLVRAS